MAQPTITVPSVEQQTGWRRPHPKYLCQDFYLCLRIEQYDFDLSDEAFQRYAKRRGVLYKAGTGDRWRITADHQATREDFDRSDCRWMVSVATGKRTRLQTPAEMDEGWLIMRSMKGAFQDAWELYLAAQAEADHPSPQQQHAA